MTNNRSSFESFLAMNILLGWTLSLILLMINNSAIASAQKYDFANEERTVVKPGLCPSPEKVDSQDLSSNCEDDGDCHGTKKCCKANTGAMLCLKAVSTSGCDVRGRRLQEGVSIMVDCYNCTCLSSSTLMCLNYNCSRDNTIPAKRPVNGSCPKMVDPGECFAHRPCQQDSECNGGQRCCDVQCGVSICITELQVPHIGFGCKVGDTYYSSGQRSNISDSQLNCHNCLCKSDGKWYCQRHLCTAKLKPTVGRAHSGADLLAGMSLLPLIMSTLFYFSFSC